MYESQHGSPMNNYSDINPYIMIYYSMNIKIHEDITREAAQNVVKQIGYMHNAIGHVFKDLAKILAYKFPQTPINHQHQPRKEQITIKNDYPKPMEIQDIEPESKHINKPKVIEKQKIVVEKPLIENKRVQIIEKRSNEQMQQGQYSDIFGQFAYCREQDEGKKNTKGLDIKSSIAKIVEEKVNKKKKEGKKTQYNEKKKSSANKQKQENVDKPKYKQDPVQRQFIYSHHNQIRNILHNNSIENNIQENDIFSQFQYQNLNQPNPNASISQQQDIKSSKQDKEPIKNDQQKPSNIIPQQQSSYWNYYKQKPEPDVYEISDDD